MEQDKQNKKKMKRDPHLHGSPSLLMHTIEPLFIQSTTNIFHNQSTFHSLKGEIRMEGERSTQSHNAYFSLSLCKVYNTWIIQHHVTGVFGNILRNLYKELGYVKIMDSTDNTRAFIDGLDIFLILFLDVKIHPVYLLHPG